MFFKTIIVAVLVASAYCRELQVKNTGSTSLTVSITGQSDITVLAGATALVTVAEDFSGTVSAVPVGLETSGTPRTKAELSLSALLDSYSISLEDGFNLRAKIIPVQGVGCSAAVCFANLNAVCPVANQVVDSLGAVVACSNSPLVFKSLCPLAVVSSLDILNVVKCHAQSYIIMFG